MNQKKFLALALAGVLTVSILAGCTKKGTDGQEPADQPSQSDTVEPGSTPETPEGNQTETPDAELPADSDAEQPTDAPTGDETPAEGDQAGGADDSGLTVSGEAADAPAAE